MTLWFFDSEGSCWLPQWYSGIAFLFLISIGGTLASWCAKLNLSPLHLNDMVPAHCIIYILVWCLRKMFLPGWRKLTCKLSYFYFITKINILISLGLWYQWGILFASWAAELSKLCNLNKNTDSSSICPSELWSVLIYGASVASCMHCTALRFNECLHG